LTPPRSIGSLSVPFAVVPVFKALIFLVAKILLLD
jgi:hypothetical protein